MANKSVEERVIQTIAEQLGCEIAQVTAEKHITNDLGADSLDRIELVMALEDEFSTEITDEDAEAVNTVQDAIDCVHKYITHH